MRPLPDAIRHGGTPCATTAASARAASASRGCNARLYTLAGLAAGFALAHVVLRAPRADEADRTEAVRQA